MKIETDFALKDEVVFQNKKELLLGVVTGFNLSIESPDKYTVFVEDSLYKVDKQEDGEPDRYLKKKFRPLNIRCNSSHLTRVEDFEGVIE